MADTGHGQDNALPRRRRRRAAQPRPRSSSIPCPAIKTHSHLASDDQSTIAGRLASLAVFFSLGVAARSARCGATRLCAWPVEDVDAGGGNRSTPHGEDAPMVDVTVSQAGSNKVSAMLGGGDDGAIVSSWAAAAVVARRRQLFSCSK